MTAEMLEAEAKHLPQFAGKSLRNVPAIAVPADVVRQEVPVDPALARVDDTLASLRARIAAPYLGCVPFGAAEDPAAAAGALDPSALGA